MSLGDELISREQALNEFCIYNSYDIIGVDKVRSYLKALPSVTPQEPNIKALGEELRKVREGIKNKKVLIGFNMAVAICNKHLEGSEE